MHTHESRAGETKQRFQSLFFLLTIFIASVLAFIAVMYATPRGLNISPDSIVYLEAARNIYSGHGYVVTQGFSWVPPTHYPPLYSVLLAGLHAAGIQMEMGARLLSAASFLVTVMMAGIIMLSVAGKSPLSLLLGVGATVVSTTLLGVHLFAHSDAPFIALSITGLYLIFRFLESRSHSMARLVAATICVASAFMMRFAGGALIITGLFSILTQTTSPLKRRIRNSILFFVGTSMPMFIFVLYSRFILHNFTNRYLSWHTISLEKAARIMDVFFNLLVPVVKFQSMILGSLSRIAVILLLGIFFVLWARHGLSMKASPTFMRISLIYCLVYVFFIFASILIFDPFIPIDNRIFSLLYIPFLFIVFYCVKQIRTLMKDEFIYTLAVICMAALVISANIIASVKLIKYVRAAGLSVTSLNMLQSETIKSVSSLPLEAIIYSNLPDPIRYYLKRPAYELPISTKKSPFKSRDDQSDMLATMATNVKSGAYVVFFAKDTQNVIFDSKYYDRYYMSESQLVSDLGLHLLSELRDGRIYVARPSK